MRLALFFVLLCFGVCFTKEASLTVTDYGNSRGRAFGSADVVINPAPLIVREFSLTYPKRQTANVLPIIGIRHMDYQTHPIKVDIENINSLKYGFRTGKNLTF